MRTQGRRYCRHHPNGCPEDRTWSLVVAVVCWSLIAATFVYFVLRSVI